MDLSLFHLSFILETGNVNIGQKQNKSERRAKKE